MSRIFAPGGPLCSVVVGFASRWSVLLRSGLFCPRYPLHTVLHTIKPNSLQLKQGCREIWRLRRYNSELCAAKTRVLKILAVTSLQLWIQNPLQLKQGCRKIWRLGRYNSEPCAAKLYFNSDVKAIFLHRKYWSVTDA